MKIAIYRVIFGDYDYQVNDLFLDKKYDYYLFTDNKNFKLKDYKLIITENVISPSLENRKLKILIPEILHSYDYVIYLDINIKICASLDYLINKFINSSSEIGLSKHPYCFTIEEEIKSCISNQKVKKEKVKDEIQYFKNNQLSPRYPLTDNSFIIRETKSYLSNKYKDEWYSCVKDFSGRDQISLPFLREKYLVKELIFKLSPRVKRNKFFVIFPHKAKNNNSNWICINFFMKLRFILMYVKYFKFRLFGINDE